MTAISSIRSLLILSSLAACTVDTAPVVEPEDEYDPLGAFDPDQLPRLCLRGNADPIAEALCGRHDIDDIPSLLTAIGLGDPERRAFAANTNSSSLVARFSSPLNPRMIVFPDPLAMQSADDVRAMGFVRGEQFVELVGYDDRAGELNFYLLRFEQACNETEEGCTLADLVTPAIESNWTRWTAYQDTDLAGTTVDCLVCHQPAGPDSAKILRMQELRAPWMHWFPGGGMGFDTRPGQTDLGTETEHRVAPLFMEAHEGEASYAGIPMEDLRIVPNVPRDGAFALEIFIGQYWSLRGDPPADLGFDLQYTTFDNTTVLLERDVGSRATWDAAFAEVRAGSRIPIPFFDVDISDEARRRAATESYLAVQRGDAPADSLLDPRDILSGEAERALSFEPYEDESAEELLQHFCERCHNDRLDQSLTRARFAVTDLTSIPPAERALASARLQLPADSPWVMPPARFATLSPEAIARLVAYLEGR